MTLLGGHALIIEDEMVIAMEMEMYLSDLGYRTFDVALSPTEAVDCARRRRPDLVTADYRIQDGTGADAVEGIVEAVGKVPVVFVTGNKNLVPAPYRDRAVDKPINRHVLNAACLDAIAE